MESRWHSVVELAAAVREQVDRARVDPALRRLLARQVVWQIVREPSLLLYQLSVWLLALRSAQQRLPARRLQRKGLSTRLLALVRSFLRVRLLHAVARLVLVCQQERGVQELWAAVQAGLLGPDLNVQQVQWQQVVLWARDP